MNNINIIIDKIKEKNNALETIAPMYKKSAIGANEQERIIEKLAGDVGISKEEATVAAILLMLKGASNAGAPESLSVELNGGKIVTKRHLQAACLFVTGNIYIRRFAESLAVPIGLFAEHFGLNGELAQTINTVLKAESGETLSAKEMAWCSSFSQNIPDLATRSSERVVRLLAEDYKRRFEGKKKAKKLPDNNKGRNKNKK